ncbi:hypothetical protein [Pseudomonas sp. UBA6323]|uniref:hypothetical protein n=1 Tax=Pseudomonas sp. UBA6323 TaxID=1947329 RepID=UPI0025D50080|nr:hypothetical protein [Pseudomonas sp. UBA6323]
MMTAKFKITLNSQNIEIEGSEEFIERQIERIHSLLKIFDQNSTSNKTTTPQPASELPLATPETIHPKSELSVPDNFGEWMYKFKEDINDQEKALICAFYVQAKSATNDFKTSEINNCLKEHGIKIANPSTNIQRLASKKLTFQTRKVGKLIYMRVSKDGESHLKSRFRGTD